MPNERSSYRDFQFLMRDFLFTESIHHNKIFNFLMHFHPPSSVHGSNFTNRVPTHLMTDVAQISIRQLIIIWDPIL